MRAALFLLFLLLIASGCKSADSASPAVSEPNVPVVSLRDHLLAPNAAWQETYVDDLDTRQTYNLIVLLTLNKRQEQAIGQLQKQLQELDAAHLKLQREFEQVEWSDDPSP